MPLPTMPIRDSDPENGGREYEAETGWWTKPTPPPQDK